MIPALLVCATANAEPDIVVVDRDNVTITKSCKVRIDRPWIADADGSGVLRITGSDITVDFDGQLLHGAEQSPPDTFSGTGVWISGRNITLRGARISGFKAGIHAVATSGLLIEDCNVSGNFRQRLRSTPRREDPSDWLRPHANDDNEWLTTYGAGVYLEESSEAKVRRVRAWGTQNGIVLDRVTASEVYDNDCSFGSGWGLAMWRSSGNVISRNAFDFRIRGYSHGKYNRGQDSAGILMFEQCSKNIITHNSATHCGDGLFGFAGAEALGQVNPRENVTWYKNRGCSRNEIGNNDFSYAAAHGLELTFSYNNRIIENRLVGNAICGIWAGYGQGSFIARNTIEDNGDMPYGSERGGINIEHGRVNAIVDNTFRNNACGIFLWWDRDEHIMKLPWSAANPTAVEGNTIRHNRFEGDRIGLQLRQTGRTTFAGNRMTNVGTEIDADAASHTFLEIVGASDMAPSRIKAPKPIGETDPIGARARLRGREYIVMTEWGPYDWRGPLLTAVQTLPDRHRRPGRRFAGGGAGGRTDASRRRPAGRRHRGNGARAALRAHGGDRLRCPARDRRVGAGVMGRRRLQVEGQSPREPGRVAPPGRGARCPVHAAGARLALRHRRAQRHRPHPGHHQGSPARRSLRDNRDGHDDRARRAVADQNSL
ncbi:MAG: right-handed parallel beta-helix repeat-containing protein [Planctomycetota bacterium]|jgi:parallel beta-helix repeat protein